MLTKAKDLPRSDIDVNKPFYHEHAILSQAAYDPIEFQKNYQSFGYEVDDELSQKSRTIFDNKDGQIVNGMDEYLSGRFRGAEKVDRQAAKKYGKENVLVTGHSLGRSQAVHVGRKYGARGTAFEPGTSVREHSEEQGRTSVIPRAASC